MLFLQVIAELYCCDGLMIALWHCVLMFLVLYDLNGCLGGLTVSVTLIVFLNQYLGLLCLFISFFNRL